MWLSARTFDRLSSGFLFLLVGAIALGFGFRMINQALEMRLFKDYLRHWEVSAQAFEATGGMWPVFAKANHVDYMETLCTYMKRAGISLPASNTLRPYDYRILRFGQKEEEIFILLLADRMILYGMSAKTLAYLDRMVDGEVDFGRGHVRGLAGKDPHTYTGQWRL